MMLSVCTYFLNIFISERTKKCFICSCLTIQAIEIIILHMFKLFFMQLILSVSLKGVYSIKDTQLVCGMRLHVCVCA